MASLVLLSLLLALLQPAPCYIFMTSSSHESNKTPHLRSLDSTHRSSSHSATSPPTKGQTSASAEGHAQELAGAEGHRLAMENGHEHSGESGESQDGMLTGVHERKDLDSPSAHTQKHMQEKGDSSSEVPVNSPLETLVPAHPGSHWDNRSRWNVSLTSAAPAVLSPEGTSGGTVQSHASSDGSDKATPPFTSSAKDLGHTQETSPREPLLTSATDLGSDQIYSSDITVAPVIWEKSTTRNKVAEGPHRTAGDNWLTAGSGDWPVSVPSGTETETSAASLATKGGRLLNLPAQVQTSTTFTAMAKAPTGSQLWPTATSSVVPSSPSPDFQAVYTPTAGIKIKQPGGSGLGNGTARIPPTTQAKVTEGRIAKARGTTSTTHQPTKTDEKTSKFQPHVGEQEE